MLQHVLHPPLHIHHLLLMLTAGRFSHKPYSDCDNMSSSASNSSSSTDSEIEAAASRFIVPDPTDDLHINEPLPGALCRRRQARTNQPAIVEEACARPRSPQLRCSCGVCREWSEMKASEKRCCNDVPEMRSIMNDVGSPDKCFTEHPDFQIVINNAPIHRITLATFDRRDRRQVNELETHKQKRYVAYCNLSRWVFRRLGKGNRIPFSACVVDSIRKAHPPPLVQAQTFTTANYPHFVGFREAPVDDMEVDDMTDMRPILRGDDE